jgi:uncharacterized repeat protein (TIGR01451 family)
LRHYWLIAGALVLGLGMAKHALAQAAPPQPSADEADQWTMPDQSRPVAGTNTRQPIATTPSTPSTQSTTPMPQVKEESSPAPAEPGNDSAILQKYRNHEKERTPPLLGNPGEPGPVAQRATPAPVSAQSTVGPAVMGPQTPTVHLEKIGPATLNAGKPLAYEIVAHNTGTVPVFNVVVEEQIPAGARLLRADPQPLLRDGLLIWNLGALEAGAERRIKLEVQPPGEGDLVSRANLTFSAASSLQTRITRPQLKLTKSGPETVQVGQPAPFQLQVTNIGTGPANGVVVRDHLPPGLRHEHGVEIEANIGTLAPGETRTISLETLATKAGHCVNEAVATGDDGLQASAQAAVTVTEPALVLHKNGPKKLFLGRAGNFEMEVANPGTASATNVQVTDSLPPELEFVSATEGGSYEPTTRKVTWNLGTLTPGQKRAFSVKLLAKGKGDPVNQAQAQADGGLEGKAGAGLHIEGVPALMLEVVDLEDPVEVGAETIYEIRVINQGTSPTTGLQIIATVPEGMATREVTGPTPYHEQGQQVIFDPLPTLAARADALFRVKVVGLKPGDMRFKVQMMSDQLRQPVYEEESTRVYKD